MSVGLYQLPATHKHRHILLKPVSLLVVQKEIHDWLFSLSLSLPFFQVTAYVRPRTVQPAVRWSVCSYWCSRSVCAGRPGGTNGLLISGCPTARPDAATVTAACPVRAPWTWTLMIQCGSLTSRLTWSLSSSWPEPSVSNMCKALLGIYIKIYVDWQEGTHNCAKRKSKLSLWLCEKKTPCRL